MGGSPVQDQCETRLTGGVFASKIFYRDSSHRMCACVCVCNILFSIGYGKGSRKCKGEQSHSFNEGDRRQICAFQFAQGCEHPATVSST